MLDGRNSVASMPADVALMASEQVLIQQERFEQILAERKAREQAKEAAQRAAELQQSRETAGKKDEAVLVDLSNAGASSSNKDNSAKPETPQSPAPAPTSHAVDISV